MNAAVFLWPEAALWRMEHRQGKAASNNRSFYVENDTSPIFFMALCLLLAHNLQG